MSVKPPGAAGLNGFKFVSAATSVDCFTNMSARLFVYSTITSTNWNGDLIVASFWYLLMTSILSYFQNKLENHYGRGFTTPATTKRRRLALRRTK